MKTETMTNGERSELLSLVKQRERVQIAAAKSRSADLLADFEKHLGTIHEFDQDDVWNEAVRRANEEVKKARQQVAAR